MRPANIVTAWADILVGFAASGAIFLSNLQGQGVLGLIPLAWLLVATTGLYGGGVVFNDVFDAALDAQERPERSIPSRRASRQGAILLGSLLLVMGVLAAAQVGGFSAILATAIALAALLYDAIAKHHAFFGPLNMGLCRGGNWLLGVSAVPAFVGERWYLALIPVGYIAAITAISQGEVRGGSRTTGIIALFLLGTVLASTVALGGLPDYRALVALPFAVFLAIRVLPTFVRAAREPNPEPIQAAVKAGVVSLIVLDAAIAAGFAGWVYGLLLLLLLPVSTTLAQRFAVT